MYVIVILKTNLLTLLLCARRLLIFSEGKGNGNAWAYRDKISLYAEIAMI